ncbi:MAG: PadR family transcriptional regulator [Thermodesulfobacteriota bacterium]
MDVRSMLLGFLTLKSMTGYELKKLFSLSFSFFSGLSYGSIYPALKKMQQEGLITVRLEIQDKAPNRKVYNITDAGRKTFHQALKAPFSRDNHKNAFLARLFFFAHLTPDERLDKAREYLKSARQTFEQLKAAGPEIEAHADRYQHLCYEFGRRFFEDFIGNISQVIQALERETP